MEIIQRPYSTTPEEEVTGEPEKVAEYIKMFFDRWAGYVPHVRELPCKEGERRVLLSRWNNCD